MTACRPTCPRCDYDLSGILPPSGPESPVSGRCPECGAEFLWRELNTVPSSGIPWLYDLPEHRGLRVRQAYQTALRLLRPARFWRDCAMAREPALARLSLWVAVVILPVYLIELALSLGLRWLLTQRGSNPTPFWPSTWSSTAEVLFHRFYDAGELTLKGTVEPVWFPDRFGLGLVVGASTPAILLMCLRPGRPDGLLSARRVLRSLAYAQVVLAAVILCYAYSLCRLNLQFAGLDVRWLPGRVVRIGVEELCALWLAWWWYNAATIGFRLPRVVGAAAALAALLTIAIFASGYWRYWDRTFPLWPQW